MNKKIFPACALVGPPNYEPVPTPLAGRSACVFTLECGMCPVDVLPQMTVRVVIATAGYLRLTY